MRIEKRNIAGSDVSLMLVPENKDESQIIDECLGSSIQNDDGLIAKVEGEVHISDGYGDHYIRLWNPLVSPAKKNLTFQSDTQSVPST